MSEIFNLLTQLHEILQEQGIIIDRLIAAGETQRQALRQNNIDEILHSLDELKDGATALERAEAQRLTLQRALEKIINIDEEISLSKLLPFAAEPLQTGLRQQLTSLRAKTASLADINAANNLLLRSAMLINGRLIQILNGSNSTYGQQGRMEDRLAQASLINKNV